jgi:hypothetical protein
MLVVVAPLQVGHLWRAYALRGSSIFNVAPQLQMLTRSIIELNISAVNETMPRNANLEPFEQTKERIELNAPGDSSQPR